MGFHPANLELKSMVSWTAQVLAYDCLVNKTLERLGSQHWQNMDIKEPEALEPTEKAYVFQSAFRQGHHDLHP